MVENLSCFQQLPLDEYESIDVDVAIIGGGPSGLATAIRLRQLALERGEDIHVCLIEKGPEIGRHILSGAVMEPRALDILLPDWHDRSPPLDTPAKEDHFCFLTEKRSFRLPTPPQMNNHGNYIVSLGRICSWLGSIAEEMGVDIFPGFAAVDVIPCDDNQGIQGVITGSMGVDKNGEKTSSFAPGIAIRARQTIIAEGCRGSLAQQLMKKFELRKHASPQTYALGMKEVWEIDESLSDPGKIIHTIGWPLDKNTYGGSFLYHLQNNRLALGFVVGLDYQNPHLFPYMELQRFKHHPFIHGLLEGGRRVSYGARSLNEGGFQAIPELVFPGGMLVGCSAGFLNVPKIKGIHTSMMSGIVAAETVADALIAQKDALPLKAPLHHYKESLQKTWLWDELYRARNIRPSFKASLYGGIAYSGIDTYIFRGKAPWTFQTKEEDHQTLKPAQTSKPIAYPKPDGVISFDRLSNLPYSGTNHEQNQPCHLRLKDTEIPVQHNLAKFDAPEQRFCPAGVYEIVENAQQEKALQINAQNCLHCKACDIKDSRQNIVWTPPQGGEGPQYESM